MKTTETKIERIQLTPTAWAEFPEVDEVRPLDDRDHAILMEVRDVLAKHKAIERFGVSLVHRHFHLNDDEIILETTDVENRSQRVEVRPASDLSERTNILETQWIFNVTRPVVCVGYCDYNKGHRHIHQSK